ncbi:hypothetical protein BKA70DRAFT_694069 [Coprinopsis sp. MPI-PUGE-AT-0042]|nr:hypothetical protein BKA70DRAFT_694069 [Coprinopsis sp. MPI-PUGE-AT-0042]
MSSEKCHQEGLVDSLPTEILVSILRRSLPLMIDKDGRREFQQLRMVCSRWRAVCLSTPLFWSSVTVDVSPDNFQEPSSATSLLKTWFSRSGSLTPLSLCFVDSNLESIEETNDDFFRFIQAHQERWSYLLLDINMNAMFKLLRTCPVINWTNLRHFGMSVAIIEDKKIGSISQADEVEAALVNRFPAVKELTYITWCAEPETICVGAQNTVERITWFTTDAAPAHLAYFLTGYHHLTHLEIRCVEETNQDALPPIVLYSLTSLAFTASPRINNWQFLGLFRTPLLSQLVLTFDRATDVLGVIPDTWQDPPIHPYADLIYIPEYVQPFFDSCNTGTLNGFSLKGTIPPRFSRVILAMLPDSITTLTLRYWPDLPSQGSERRFFPKLESLFFSDVPSRCLASPNAAMSVEALASFLSQRMDETVEHVRLRSLEVTRDKYFPNEEVERLKERGLNVVVWAQSPS